MKKHIRKYCRTETVFQMEAAECGAACLSMILGYYGKHVGLEQVRIGVGVNRDGSKAGNILRAAAKYGLEAHGYRRELFELEVMEPPCVIHWNFDHFVVYEGTKGGMYYLNDPAVGHRTVTEKELDWGYTGIVLTFRPTDGFVKQSRRRTFLPDVQKRLQTEKAAAAALFLMGGLLVLPGFLMAAFSQIFVDDILEGGNSRWLGALLAALLVTLLCQTFFQELRSRLLIRLQNKITLENSRLFICHMLQLPMDFFEQRSAGDLSGRIDTDSRISEFVSGELMQTVVSLFESAFYLFILLWYSPLLTLAAVTGMALDFALVHFGADRVREFSLKYSQDAGELNGSLLQGIRTLDALKAAGAENSYTGMLLGKYAKVCQSEQRMKRMQQNLNAFPQAVRTIVSVLILMLGSLLVIQGKMTVGALVAFTTILAAFLTPLGILVRFAGRIQMSKSNMSRVDDIMNSPAEEKYSSLERTAVKIAGHVTVKDLEFGYGPVSPSVISDISFDVPAGKSLAIVGTSGSGKSTVAKLLCGLYEPRKGSICFDGAPAKTLAEGAFPVNVTCVSQETVIFAASVRDNITLWNSHIPDEDIIQAAKDAGIHEVINAKPGAYSCRMTEGGRNFSGGQRQKLEIARALALNPSVLVLDEATSALDTIQEAEVMSNIRRRGCTLIVIAHRLSAVRDCDEVIVMDQGKIIEHGTHDTLMEQEKSLYRRLVQQE